MRDFSDTIRDALKLKKNPSALHIRVRDRINNTSKSHDYKEFQVVRLDGEYTVVNFYSENLSIAVNTSDSYNDQNIGDIRVITLNQQALQDVHTEKIAHSIFGGRGVSIQKDDGQNWPNEVQLKVEDPISTTIDFDTDSVSDLIEVPSSWLLRSGMGLLALVTIIILALSNIITYPDKLMAHGFVSTEQPPLALLSKENAIINEIFVENGANVIVGQELLNYKSTTSLETVKQYSDWITKAKNGTFLSLDEDLNLGSLQGSYAQLVLFLKQFEEVRSQQNTFWQLTSINEEVSNIKLLNNSIREEENHFKSEERLAKAQLERSNKLFQEGLIAKVELEQAERSYEQFARLQESTNKNLIQNNIRSEQLKLEASKIEEERTTELRNRRFQINELITKIESEIKEWLDRKVVYAESVGRVEFGEYIETKYNVSSGQHLGYIIPDEDNNQKVVNAELPASGIGRVKKGAKCIVKLENFPYKEYGVVTSPLTSISLVPSISGSSRVYHMSIELPNKIITDYDILIPYSPNMAATIEVITENKTVFERIFQGILSITKTRSE